MLPNKPIPNVSVSVERYYGATNTATVRITWKTPKPIIYKYNGDYISSDDGSLDIQTIDDLEWAAGNPLPGQNSNGETSEESATVQDINNGSYVYARVRIGTNKNGWGLYGYVKRRIVPQTQSVSTWQGYVYIAYASDDNGADFSLTFDPDLAYIAILRSVAPVDVLSAVEFSGLWMRYKGEDGDPGEPGVNGIDGVDGIDAPNFIVNNNPPDDEIGEDGDFWVAYDESTGQVDYVPADYSSVITHSCCMDATAITEDGVHTNNQKKYTITTPTNTFDGETPVAGLHYLVKDITISNKLLLYTCISTGQYIRKLDTFNVHKPKIITIAEGTLYGDYKYVTLSHVTVDDGMADEYVLMSKSRVRGGNVIIQQTEPTGVQDGDLWVVKET